MIISASNCNYYFSSIRGDFGRFGLGQSAVTRIIEPCRNFFFYLDVPVLFKVKFVNVVNTSMVYTFLIIRNEVVVSSFVIFLYVCDINIEFVSNSYCLRLYIAHYIRLGLFLDKRFRFFRYFRTADFGVLACISAAAIDNFKNVLVLRFVR